MAKRSVRKAHGHEKEVDPVWARMDKLRAERGLTKSDLGRLLGLSDESAYRKIYAWETGEITVSADYVRAAARVFGVTADELLGLRDGEPPYASWREFLATVEGRSITETESRSLRTFEWGKPPTVDDWRALLDLRRKAGQAS